MALVGSGSPGITKLWSEYANTVTYDDLPSPVVAFAKCVVTDTLGVMLGASTLERACSLVQRIAGPESGAPESTLIGYGRRAPVLLAAMVNGATGHALNYDAVGPNGGDIGVASVPGPLAVAEQRGRISGRRLLTAVSIGAELTVRLVEAVDLGPDRAPQRFTEGQLFGYFAAAAGAGHVLGLTPAQMQSALGFAFMQAAGGGQPSHEGKEAKTIYGGFFSSGGVMSALLAAEGTDASCLAFEGERGLFQTFFEGKYEPPALTDDVGREYRILGAGFKVWPTSGWMHLVVEGALAVAHEPGFRSENVEHVVVKALPRFRTWTEPVDERRHPHNLGVATNSLHFAVGAALSNGSFTLADLTERGLVQEEVIRIAEACDFLPMGPDEKEGVVEVTFKDGSRRSVPVGMSHKDRVKPVSYARLQEKFRDCARHASVPIPEERVEKALLLLEQLEELDDVRVLTDLFV